jgi:hypothetical protein
VTPFWRRAATRRPRAGELHVGDPRFDSWETVGDSFEDLPTAQSFAAHLTALGFACALTADQPLDRFGRGEIWLCVPPESYGDATVALDGLDDD